MCSKDFFIIAQAFCRFCGDYDCLSAFHEELESERYFRYDIKFIEIMKNKFR